MAPQYNKIGIPHSRGFKHKPNKLIVNKNPDNARDILINAVLGRIAGDDNSTHELYTYFDNNGNQIELCIPDNYIDLIEKVNIGPNMRRYLDWLLGNRDSNQDDGLTRFSITSSTTTPLEIARIRLEDGDNYQIEFNVTARQTDGSQRASFRRTGLFYKEQGRDTQISDVWQSDYTTRTSKSFNVIYELLGNEVIFKVVNANPIDTEWQGYVIF